MKKLNIKALLVDHVEKFVFGFFSLIVLAILTVGTTWARYEKTPEQLKRSAEDAKTKITSNNPWPKDKEAAFKVIDFSERAKLLFQMPLIAKYDFSQWLFHPLYKKNEPKREPTYEPVQNLIANFAFVPLSVISEEARQQMADQAAGETGDEAAPAEGNEDSEFGVRSNSNAGGPGGAGRFPGGMAAPVGGAPLTAGTLGSAGAARPPGAGGPPKSGSGKKGSGAAAPSPATGPGLFGASAGQGAAMAPGMMMPGMSSTGGMGGMGGMNSGIEARGVRVMAVRGVFPIQKQIDNYKNSLHVTQDEAAELLEITDFILERQVALPGSDPWKDSPWVEVNIGSALEVLGECSDLDFEDPVPTALRDAVITMDLPLNLLGVWKNFATHPLIKNEELSLEQIEEEARLLEKVNEVADSTNLTDPTQQRRKGLARVQRDFKRIAGAVNANDDSRSMMDQMMKSMGSPPGAAGGGANSGLGAMRPPGMGMGMGMGMNPGGGMRGASSALDRLLARRRFLLFRYFDFDVEFGMAYRYRVKLKLRNPNFERPADELGDIEIAKGEERETPWSNISNPDVVRSKHGYFLKDIEREPYRDDKVKWSQRPVALLSMYDWDTKLGAVLNDVLNLNAIGSFVGEEKKSTIIPDLVANTLEKGEHKFTTQDALLDVEGDFDVAPDQHPDLVLTAERGRPNARLGLMEEALVVTSTGELRTIEQSQGAPVNESDREALRFWKRQEDREHKAIKAREAAPLPTGTETEGEDGGRKKVNPRKQGAMAAMSSMMMPSSMPPGYSGAPPGVGGAQKKAPRRGSRRE